MEQMTQTPSQDIISLFRQRFIQREDCYPLQIAGNGGYTVIREPITDAIKADHPQGSKTIGLYSSPDSTTKWLCIDIDTLDETELLKVQQRASHLGIPFLTEFSGKKATKSGYSSTNPTQTALPEHWDRKSVQVTRSSPNKTISRPANLGTSSKPRSEHIKSPATGATSLTGI